MKLNVANNVGNVGTRCQNVAFLHCHSARYNAFRQIVNVANVGFCIYSSDSFVSKIQRRSAKKKMNANNICKMLHFLHYEPTNGDRTPKK